MAEQFHHQQQLKNPKYRNWVKAGLGLKYLKDGLQIFSDEKVKQQHDDIVNAVKRKHNLTTVNCGQCSLRTLQPDHVRNKNKQCPLGCKDCNCQYPGGKNACPNNVCGAIYDQIILNHDSNPPAPFWKNTCVQKWCTDEWEVAKCFINAPGYASKSNASEIDCTGLLHLFINSKFLQTKIACKITSQGGGGVFSKTRSARNAIFHSTSMEMDDVEFIQYIDDMIAVLEDGKELLNRPESIAAVAMLDELKNSRFVISNLNEAEIVREAMAVIDLKETTLKETVEAATNEILLSKTDTVQLLKSAGEDFNLKAKQNLDLIEKTGNEVINDIELNTEKARDQIKADTDAKTEDCKTFIRLAQFEACEKIENVKKAAIDHITETAETVSQNLETAVTSTSQRIVKMEEQVTDAKKEIVEVLQHSKLTYVQSKEAFRRRLIEMYVENVVNISPILLQPERCDVRIDQVYIDPLIKILPKDENEKSERIQSYQELFRKDGKQQKSIYLIGEAGSGKSTFCINMINNWCIAHSDNEAEDTMNIQEMKQYQFLFYLPLRHEDIYDHVEEMILSHYDDPIIRTIFEQEPEDCLILLDGLDEWILKTEPKTSLFQSKGLPRRNLSKGYTIITTSRPWKFESIGLKSTEIQIKLQLCGVDNQKAMIEKTVNALNEMFHTKKNTSDFQNYLANSRIDNEMRSVPIILQQLICLWFDNKISCIGKSDIYSKMLGMLFEWTELRTGNENVLRGLRDKSSNIDILDIPDQLNYRELGQELKFVIKNIAHLAYATLITTSKESSLIFDDSTFKNLNIDNEVITYSLKCGIISKQCAVGLNLSRRKHLSFSFVHKSMQEFLCALHIFIELKRSATYLFKPFLLSKIDKNLICFKIFFDKCKTANDILDLSNVFTFLCGFDTYLAAHISKFMYNIVAKDEALINYRTILSYIPFKLGMWSIFLTFECFEGHQTYPLDIQNLLFSFIKEANMHEEKPGRLFFLSDFVYFPMYTRDVEPIKYVNPAFIISLNIDILGTPLPPILSEFLNDPFLGPKMSTLKLRISLIDDCQLNETLLNIMKRSCCFLKCLSFKGHGADPMLVSPTMHFITKLLISALPIMNKLETIKLENIGLTFCEIMNLSKWLSNAKYLRQISLRKISDYPDKTLIYENYPSIHLSQHRELKVLDHDFHEIEMTKFCVHNLETCSFYLRSNFISKSVATVLKQSKKLKCLNLTGDWVCLDKDKVTKIIQNLLPNLIDLKQLHLENFYFSENIIVDPMKMLNLREITLEDIHMCADSWDRLLESVFRLPQNVKIHIRNMSIDFRFWNNILHKRRCRLLNLKIGSSYVTFSKKPEGL